LQDIYQAICSYTSITFSWFLPWR